MSLSTILTLRRDRDQGHRSVRTLADAFHPRRNSLNALRVALAAVVIASHAWPTGGFGEDPKLGGEGAGRWAVAGFFAISGYLVTDSRCHLGLGGYLSRRAARILPGYWACLVVTAFIAAPAAARWSGTSWDLGAALQYVVGNVGLVVTTPTIGDTLANAHDSSTWNGSLWTLKWELLAYLAVGVALGLPLLRRRRSTFLVILLVLVLGQLGARLAGVGPGVLLDALWLSSDFAAGAVLYFYRDRVRIDGRLLLAAVAVIVAADATGTLSVFGAVPIAYLMMWLAVTLPLHRAFRRTDISYGLYIYGFVVQQCLALLGVARLGVAAMAVAGIVATVPIAWASWVLVERPARDVVHSAFRRRAGQAAPGVAPPGVGYAPAAPSGEATP